MNLMLLLAALTVDFNVETVPVRPELHSSGFGPLVCSCPQESIDDIRSMGFAAARTHDFAPAEATFADGRLTLGKSDAESAAFLVEFE